MAETWLPVVGYEGYYEVSDLGRVRGTDRVVPGKDGRSKRLRSKMLALLTQKSGHLYVCLCRDNRPKHHRVHRLVLTAHGGEPEPGQVCRHLDGNPENNALANLAWGTYSENANDRVGHGNHYLREREKCSRGHPLTAPNLVDFELRRGCRKCKACHRGRSMCVRENDLSPERMQANSDWQFTRIMNGE